MARYKKLINNAENHLVVGSLEVIGSVKSNSIVQIKRTVETLQTNYKTLTETKKDYWSDLSNDGLITPVEKLILLKEWETIDVTHASLMVEARNKELENLASIVAYDNAFYALKTLLFNTLDVFSEMSQNTEIDDRERFNQYYSTYYSAENFVQSAIAVGTIGTVEFLVVSNLDFAGEEEQVVIYNGELYQYLGGKWVKIGFNGYLGVLSQQPQEELEGFYFLSSKDFTGEAYILSPLAEEIISPEDKAITILQEYEYAYIYEYTNGIWQKVTNLNDNRYAAIMFDYYQLTGGFPPIIQNELKDLQEQIDDINTKPGTHIPAYIGLMSLVVNIPMASASNLGDWFLWNGANTSYADASSGLLNKGKVYKCVYYSATGVYVWQELTPSDSENQSYYMACLDDVLSQTDVVGTSAFSTLFADAFFAHSASINALQTKSIVITGNNGLIKSSLYTAGSTTQKGFLLKADGTLDCVNGSFRGDIEATNGIFYNNNTVFGNFDFKSTLSSTFFFIEGDYISSIVKEFAAGSSIYYLYMHFYNILGSTDNYVDIGTVYNVGNNYTLEVYYGTTKITNVKVGTFYMSSQTLYFNDGAIKLTYSNELDGDFSLEYKYIATKITKEKQLTYKLKNLPSSKPSISNCVYCESDGILRLS